MDGDGNPSTKSSVQRALTELKAEEFGGLAAQLLPCIPLPSWQGRLYTRLPVATFSDVFKFTQTLEMGSRLQHYTHTPSAQLLATPMRDSSVHGLALQRAHESTGHFLALRVVDGELGLEAYQTTSVEGKIDQGPTQSVSRDSSQRSHLHND